jgi:hypothetical protein
MRYFCGFRAKEIRRPAFPDLRQSLQADLIFVFAVEQLRPDHFELHSALAIKHNQRIEWF